MFIFARVKKNIKQLYLLALLQLSNGNGSSL